MCWAPEMMPLHRLVNWPAPGVPYSIIPSIPQRGLNFFFFFFLYTL